ncbi:MAG: hypothetical protein JWL85_186 [Candidatus Saccharibacteria bacterium]|nr:hypothetical protein [Candidatus Saccharibacteria bacterium]
MDFKAVSARWGETLVTAVPSTPDGYFIFEDLLTGRNRIDEVALRRIKPRHVRKLKRGDVSVMGRYTESDPNRPGFVRFIKCEAMTPDPLQPVGTAIYIDGVQEVSLDRASQLRDAHRAVGEWWAQRLLNPVIDEGGGEKIHPVISDDQRRVVAQRAGDFALILAGLSRSSDTPRMTVDYYPDSTLRDAADMAFVPAVFSLMSYTHIDEGVVMAREGWSGEVIQIWPPAPEATAPQEL